MAMVGCLPLQGGKFSARLVLGDVGASAGVSWELGPLELLLAPGAGLEPKDAVRTAKFQPINDVKPEIVHMFVSGAARGVASGAAF